MLLIAAVLLSFALSSDPVCNVAENNETTGLNPGCNNVGICRPADGRIPIRCECCQPGTCGEKWICDKENPFPECYYWEETDCTQVSEYYYSELGFRAESSSPADINCSTIPELRSKQSIYGVQSIDFTPQIKHLLQEKSFTAHIQVSPFCDTCSEQYPCSIGINTGVDATTGTTYAFQADFNTFYDSSCRTDDNIFYRSVDNYPDCPANFDLSGSAFAAFSGAIGIEDNFLSSLNDLLKSEPTALNSNLGLGWVNSELVGFRTEDTKIKRTFTITNVPSAAPTYVPTADPTTTPTVDPTATPTESECGPYTNNVADLKFSEMAVNCRGGLLDSYPGGLTCESPYLICLPRENTPAKFDGQDYKSSDHSYSLEECKQECANDQRCRGIEWITNGNCTLIDDIPVVGYNDGKNTPNANCWVKKDYCNPSFEADDLKDTMLNCYCPNNRKGSYTKKVQRTVANTRFCGNDTEVDTRVKKAHANRMFHLCENWCLFSTDTPMDEAFYWDPWKKCFREQNMDSGVHMSYCNRVIRSPNTIEMQFILNRTAIQCQDN